MDIDTELQDAQVRDLSDAALFYESVTKVQAATHREASQADVVIITEGMKPTPGNHYLTYECTDLDKENWLIPVHRRRHLRTRIFQDHCTEEHTQGDDADQPEHRHPSRR